MRPLIGITTYLTRATFGAWETESALVPADYVRAVERAGGRPLLVPPSNDGVEETLDALDGARLLRRLRPRPASSTAHDRAPEATDGIAEERDERRAGAAAGGARARHAGARDLPRLAAAERRARRRPRPAPARGRRARRAQGAARRRSPTTTSRSSEGTLAARARSASTRPSSRTTTRASAASATACACRRAPRTARRGARGPRRAASRSACSGTPRPGEDARLFEALVGEARDYRAAR